MPIEYRVHHRPHFFVLLLAVTLVIAIGHLFLIADFTALQWGVPVWLWMHLATLVVLLGLAWIAIEWVFSEEI